MRLSSRSPTAASGSTCRTLKCSSKILCRDTADRVAPLDDDCECGEVTAPSSSCEGLLEEDSPDILLDKITPFANIFIDGLRCLVASSSGAVMLVPLPVMILDKLSRFCLRFELDRWARSFASSSEFEARLKLFSKFRIFSAFSCCFSLLVASHSLSGMLLGTAIQFKLGRRVMTALGEPSVGAQLGRAWRTSPSLPSQAIEIVRSFFIGKPRGVREMLLADPLGVNARFASASSFSMSTQLGLFSRASARFELGAFVVSSEGGMIQLGRF